MKLHQKIVSMVTMMAMLVSSSASLKVEAATTSITYMKYSFAEDGGYSSYSLVLSDSDTSLQRGIVPPDERQAAGFDGVVRISNGTTGFIVGDHVIATAAHCVNEKHLDPDERTTTSATKYFRTNLKIELYNEDGSVKDTDSLKILEIHMPSQYYLNADYLVKDDYALIYVEEDLSEYTHFDLGIPYDISTANFAEIPLFATGFPQDKPSNQMYTSMGFLYTGGTSSKDTQLFYTCDTVGGNSGSPVYVACRYTVNSTSYTTYTAIAVNAGPGVSTIDSDGNKVTAANTGAAITSQRIQFYLNNPNIGS